MANSFTGLPKYEVAARRRRTSLEIGKREPNKIVVILERAVDILQPLLASFRNPSGNQERVFPAHRLVINVAPCVELNSGLLPGEIFYRSDSF